MEAEATNGGTLLTYTVTNDRGWNDPPIHIFSPGGGNRKKNNLNKRVGHSLNSNGNSFLNQTPFHQNGIHSNLHSAIKSDSLPQSSFHQNRIYNNLHPVLKTDALPQNNCAAGVLELSNNLEHVSFNHSNSNPDLQKVCSSSSQMHHAVSYPYDINKVGLSSLYNPNCLISSESSCSSNNDHLKTSENQNNYRRFSDVSVPGKVSDPLSILSQLGTPTMLKSSHLQTETKDSVQSSDASFLNYDKSRISPINGYQTPPIPEHQNEDSLVSSIPLGQSTHNNGYLVSNSSTEFQKSNLVGPPPTVGYYIQNGKSSPNRSSPVNLRARSPLLITNVNIENDNELLESTIKNLQECKEKCLCRLNSRNSDEINKKIISFQQSWLLGKLSAIVKLQMSELAIALMMMDFTKADQIHKSLILDHSNEVTSWIVGIKKLVVTSQQTLIENNKFTEDKRIS
uniref:Steroid receptor RNA activator 1 n=1 Tax=Hydra vulgaris TaxID=6087 RepID=T2M5I9_HYDVU